MEKFFFAMIDSGNFFLGEGGGGAIWGEIFFDDGVGNVFFSILLEKSKDFDEYRQIYIGKVKRIFDDISQLIWEKSKDFDHIGQFT